MFDINTANNFISYYKVENGELHRALIEWRNHNQEIAKRYMQYSESVGGIGYFAGPYSNVSNGVAIYAVLFEDELPKGWKKAPSRFQTKRGQFAGIPDKRGKIGKSAIDDIDALPQRLSASHVTKNFGIPDIVSGHKENGDKISATIGPFLGSSVGFIKDTFYLCTGDYPSAKKYYETKGYTVEMEWEPIDGMVKILKEQVDLDFALYREANE